MAKCHQNRNRRKKRRQREKNRAAERMHRTKSLIFHTIQPSFFREPFREVLPFQHVSNAFRTFRASIVGCGRLSVETKDWHRFVSLLHSSLSDVQSDDLSEAVAAGEIEISREGVSIDEVLDRIDAALEKNTI